MPSSNTELALMATTLAVLSAGCPTPFSCDECDETEVCWQAEERCTDRCLDESQCASGHGCIAVGDQMACDVRCADALCAPDRCTSAFGTCLAVECSETRACAAPGEACDEANFECYPVNGDCAARSCYQFAPVTRLATISCGPDDFCHVAPLPIEPPWLDDFDPPPALGIAAPTPGQSFASGADVVLSWADPGTAVIAYILARVPEHASGIAAAALWGIAVPAGGPTTVGLGDGGTVDGGEWVGGATSLPTDQPLYAFAFAVRQGEVEAVSLMVPFRVAGGWAVVDDACEGAAHLPDDCFNPASVQACRDGRCRRVCASHADCSDLGLLCAEAIDGVRICE